MTNHVPAASFCAALLTLMAGKPEAEVLYSFESPTPESMGWFGYSVSVAEDVDNDGYDEVIVGAEQEDGGGNNAGRAYVFSGATGETLYVLQSPIPRPAGHFGCSVSGIGDVNGDGHPDLVIGAQNEDGGAYHAGRAYVFSGATGDTLYRLESPSPEISGWFGYRVSRAGDVNNDGCDDVIVGACYEDGGEVQAGRAYVFSGATGDILHRLESPNPGEYGVFGVSVSGAGDVNGDGWNDVIVGASQEHGGAFYAGRAYLFDGAGGGLLQTLVSPNPAESGRFGCSVSGAGDLTDDGCDDVLVGAYGEHAGWFWAGRAYAIDGATGSILCTLQSPDAVEGGYFGCAVSRVGDVNGDGYEEVLVGARGESGAAPSAGRAYIFNAREGSRLCTLQSPTPGYDGGFGYSVSWGGDVNGDGHDDAVVGALGEEGGAYQAGRAYVFSPHMVLACSLCGGALTLQWSPWPGTAAYWVYGADSLAYFAPGLAPGYQDRLAVLSPLFLTWSSPNGIGDPASNWTYLVLAVDASEQETIRSNRVGEHDFSTTAGP